MICKCHFPEGIDIRPDGINALDPCVYKRKEEHRNVTVFLDQCVKCGHIQISWKRTEKTESIVYDKLIREKDDDIVIQRTIQDDDDSDYDKEEDDEWLDNPD